MSGTQVFRDRWSRRVLWGCGLAVVIAIIIGALARRDNVRYQGRLLSDYFVDLVRPTGSSSYAVATNAVLSVGRVGLPIVLRQIKHATPLRVRFYLSTKDWLPDRVVAFLSRNIDPYYYVNRHQGAIRAVGILGTDSLPVLDELMVAYGRLPRTDRYLLANEFLKIGPEVVPRMSAFLKDSRMDVRRDVAEFFGRLGRDGATAAPSLFAGLEGADEEYFRTAARALCQIGPGADWEIEMMLQSNDYKRRRAVVEALSTFGRYDAKNQERLFKCLDDPDFEVRLQATAGLVHSRHYDIPIGVPGNALVGNNLDRTAAMDAQLQRLLKVLNDGLQVTNPTNRLAAAEGLVRMGQAGTNLVVVLQELQKSFDKKSMQMYEVRDLLREAQDQLSRRRLIERALENAGR